MIIFIHMTEVHFVSNNIPRDAQQLQLRFVTVQMSIKMIIWKLEINDCRFDDPLFQYVQLAT
jgi:hypothetical protein